ncbi:nickel ABC transporter permease [Paenibacillus sp. UNC451MF]|uniref:nickel ABC transporter permease n=1 Tax=Paenibacillus sp. UNC451MF TaxID=1449063 RepID=UPI00048CB088|nr:nickel ABC transporter permease [Paenibacillus sp. UNC451MF]
MTYFFRRLAAAIPVLIGISFIAFALSVASPGDPAVESLSLNGIKEPTEQEVAAKREELGLNDPLTVQYAHWLWKASHGDLGISYMTKESVSGELLRRLPVTLSVSGLALLIAVGTGIPLGMLMALKKNKPLDHAARILALTLVSIPGFWLAILLITVFSEKLHWLPTSGYGTFKHLIMPAIVLAAGTSAVLMRLTRAALLEVWNQAYIVTAKAKGLRDIHTLFIHALRNAMIPLITVIGSYFGTILGGSVIVEVIFAIPGIGRFAMDGIFRRDYPVIQGYVVFTGFVYVSFNLLVDLSYLVIHPQMRLGGKLQ